MASSVGIAIFMVVKFYCVIFIWFSKVDTLYVLKATAGVIIGHYEG